jgi:hypothetical protein
MNTFVLLQLQESVTQCGAGKQDQWRGYITVLVVNQGIIKSISIYTAVIHPMIKFDVDKPWDCFHQEVKWTLAIRYQLSTLSLGWIWTAYTTFHMLCDRKKILIVCQKGINEFQML